MDASKMLKRVSDKKFENLREGIRQELLSANEHFHIMSEFIDVPGELTNIMRGKYAVFFYYTRWAHIKLLCISLYNVTKHDDQTSNIPRLLCHIRFHKILSQLYPSNVLDDIEHKLKANDEFLNKVYILRDQHYAHNQSNRKQLEITLDDIRKGCQSLLPDLQNIYDSLSFIYDGSSWIFRTVPGPNIRELLTDLTEYKKIKRNHKRSKTTKNK